MQRSWPSTNAHLQANNYSTRHFSTQILTGSGWKRGSFWKKQVTSCHLSSILLGPLQMKSKKSKLKLDYRYVSVTYKVRLYLCSSKRWTLASAVRLSDGLPVILKRVELDSPEFEISVLFSSPPLSLDPRNHCVPIHHLKYKEFGILVLPLLRKFDDPPFDTVGEVLECFRQIFEVGSPVHI